MRNAWTHDELLLTLHLYCRTSFGRLHKTNPEIVELAQIIGRTPSSVAMKACNFAYLDPATGGKGMSGASKADKALWEQLKVNSEDIANEAQALYEARVEQKVPTEAEIDTKVEPTAPAGPTEVKREAKVRRVQSFFRMAVLQSYNHQCAISGLSMPELLIASHIVPWSEDASRRADPSNGIALHALYDKAFDQGLIAFDDDFKLLVSKRLREKQTDETVNTFFIAREGSKLLFPERFSPDVQALAYHREKYQSLY